MIESNYLKGLLANLMFTDSHQWSLGPILSVLSSARSQVSASLTRLRLLSWGMWMECREAKIRNRKKCIIIFTKL